ncbi:hypothetical protein RA29_19340 [Tateyamaria sp. ANG-S1]|nr:hypothetical protein RA29_19340 [Tateyamaria sp. ANG-S1]
MRVLVQVDSCQQLISAPILTHGDTSRKVLSVDWEREHKAPFEVDYVQFSLMTGQAAGIDPSHDMFGER